MKKIRRRKWKVFPLVLAFMLMFSSLNVVAESNSEDTTVINEETDLSSVQDGDEFDTNADDNDEKANNDENIVDEVDGEESQSKDNNATEEDGTIQTESEDEAEETTPEECDEIIPDRLVDGIMIKSKQELQNNLSSLEKNSQADFILSDEFDGEIGDVVIEGLDNVSIAFHVENEHADEQFVLNGSFIIKDQADVELNFNSSIYLTKGITLEEAKRVSIKNLTLSSQFKGSVEDLTVYNCKIVEAEAYFGIESDNYVSYKFDQCEFDRSKFSTGKLWDELKITNSEFHSTERDTLEGLFYLGSGISYRGGIPQTNLGESKALIENTKFYNVKMCALIDVRDKVRDAVYEGEYVKYDVTFRDVDIYNNESSRNMILTQFRHPDSVIKFENSRINNNKSTLAIINNHGGLFWINNSTLRDNGIDANYSIYGLISPGVLNGQKIIVKMHLRIQDSLICNNASRYYGTVINTGNIGDKLGDYSIEIIDSELSSNHAGRTGGAIHMPNLSLNVLSLHNAIFKDNTAGQKYLYPIHPEDVKLYNEMFSGEIPEGSIPAEEFEDGNAHLLNQYDISYERNIAWQFVDYKNPSGMELTKGKMPEREFYIKESEVEIKDFDLYMFGYKFLGWSEQEDADTPQYKAGDKFEITSNVVLYAVWEKIENPVEVNYYIYDTSQEPDKTVCYSVGDEITIEGPQEAEKYSEISGWRKTKNQQDAIIYKNGDKITVTENTDLYAHWELDNSGGSGGSGGSGTTEEPGSTEYLGITEEPIIEEPTDGDYFDLNDGDEEELEEIDSLEKDTESEDQDETSDEVQEEYKASDKFYKSVPKTGDNSFIYLSGFVLIVSLVGMILSSRKSLKR